LDLGQAWRSYSNFQLREGIGLETGGQTYAGASNFGQPKTFAHDNPHIHCATAWRSSKLDAAMAVDYILAAMGNPRFIDNHFSFSMCRRAPKISHCNV